LATDGEAAVGLAVEMPLAGVTGAIAGALEQLGHGRLGGPQINAAIVVSFPARYAGVTD
jgi:hypothetical protein